MLPNGLHLSAVEPGGGSPPPPAPAPSADPGAPPAPGSAAAPPAASPNDGNIRQLREQYETTKQDRDEWAKLGTRDDVQRSHQTYTKIATEASALGTQLGYSAEEIQQALQSDPIGTIAALRQMAQRSTGEEKPLTRAEVERLADAKAKAALRPFQQEREQRLDTEAQAKFDGEFDRQFKTSFPNGWPDSAKEALSGLAWQLLTDNKDGYGSLRAKGDVAAVAAAFNSAKTTMLKLFSDLGEHEKKRVGGEPPLNPGIKTPKKGRSFAEIAMALNDESISDDVALGRR